MDSQVLAELSDLLDQAEPFHPPTVEKTLFSAGARAHYENPVSDLLAFFLNPEGEHGLDDLFLSALIACVQSLGIIPQSVKPELEQPPNREVTTKRGNRIDLVLTGADWVLVVENKIFAGAPNPFEDYESHIGSTSPYDAKAHRAHVLLGMFEPPLLPPWRFVRYRDFLHQVKQSFGQHLLGPSVGKWLILAREFLLHLEQLGGQGAMDDEAIDFVTAHYARIEHVMRLRRAYLDDLKEKLRRCAAETGAVDARVTEHTWRVDEIQALKLRAGNWQSSDITLMIYSSDGSGRVRMYVDLDQEARTRADEHFAIDGVDEKGDEGQRLRYYTFQRRANPKTALPDVDRACKLFSRWYPAGGAT